MIRVRLLVWFIVLTACWGNRGTSSLSGRSTGVESLTQIPAETPYVLVSLDSKIKSPWMPSMTDVYEVLEEVGHDDETPGARFVRRLLAELKDGNRFRTAKELGFSDDGRFVLYGLSLWPVLRISVDDAGKLRALAERVLAGADPRLQQRRLDGVPYWIGSFGEIAIVAAVLDHELVLAVLPSAQVDRVLPIVIGTERPAKTLAAEKVIDKQAARYGFLRTWFGYADSARVLDLLAGGGSELERALGALWLRSSVGSAMLACKTDFGRVARAVPRIVLGYRRIDESVVDGALVIEAPELGRSLASIRGEVPAIVGERERPLFSMSIAADSTKLAGWAQHLAAGLRANPLRCPGLAKLDEAIRSMAAALAQLPSMARGLRGAAVVVDDVVLETESGTGTAIVVADQVSALVSSLWAMPPLAGSTPPVFGLPTALPLQQLGFTNFSSAHVALSSNRLAIAVGPDSRTRVGRTLAARTAKRIPLVQGGFDIVRADELGLFEGKDRSSLENLDYMKFSFDANEGGLVLGLTGTWRKPRAK